MISSAHIVARNNEKSRSYGKGKIGRIVRQIDGSSAKCKRNRLNLVRNRNTITIDELTRASDADLHKKLTVGFASGLAEPFKEKVTQIILSAACDKSVECNKHVSYP